MGCHTFVDYEINLMIHNQLKKKEKRIENIKLHYN